MAFEAGKGAVLKLDDSAGTLTDISAYLTNVDFPQEVVVVETTAFGKTSREFVVGLKNATISLSGHWDGAASAIDALLNGILGTATTKTFEYGPHGSATGDIRYTGESILTRYGVVAAVEGGVDFTADLQVSGAVTRNTFP